LDTTNSTAFHTNGLSGWLGNQGVDNSPYVVKNVTASPVRYANTTWQPGQLAINPVVGFYGVLRWTAPSSGLFNITATFSGLSSALGGDSTDVHILLNGTSIFDSIVLGSPSPVKYSGIQNLANGDRIDFAVGIGPDGNDYEDTTALAASIVAVPEPSTLGLVGAGLGCLLSFRFLKRR
jgi:hypothetical protein